ALGVGLAGALPLQSLWGEEPAAKASNKSTPESLVKVLYDTLSPGQKEAICFDWDHTDEGRGLLRARVSRNWGITDKFVSSEFYKPEQRELIRKLFEGIIDASWHERIDQQLDDDSGGFGTHNSIAIFG